MKQVYRYGEVLYSIELFIMGFISFLYIFPGVMEHYVVYYTIVLIALNMLGLSFKALGLSTQKYTVVHVLGLVGVVLLTIFPFNYIFTVANVVLNWKRLKRQMEVAYRRWVEVDVDEVRKIVKRKYGEGLEDTVIETKQEGIKVDEKYLEGYQPIEKEGTPKEIGVRYDEDEFNKVELTEEEQAIMREEADYEEDDGLTLPSYYKKYLDGDEGVTLNDLFGDD